MLLMFLSWFAIMLVFAMSDFSTKARLALGVTIVAVLLIVIALSAETFLDEY